MVLCKLWLWESIKDDVIFEYRLRGNLAHIEQLTVDIVDSNFVLDLVFFHVDVILDQSFLSFCLLFFVIWLLVAFQILENRDILRIFLATCDEVPVVCELVIWVARWLWESVIPRIQHNVSFLVIDRDFESKKEQSVFFVDVIGNGAEFFTSET